MNIRMNIRNLIVASTLSAIAAGAWAQGATPRIDQRQQEQQARIAQGVASGELTPRETYRLQREQRAISRAERQAKADGVFTAQERRHIAHMQDRASRHIPREKHDAQAHASFVPTR